MDASARFLRFGRYELDRELRVLRRDGQRFVLTEQQIRLLSAFINRAGTVVPKERLIDAAWPGQAVTDDSLNKAISRLRAALGPGDDGQPLIENAKRHGFRFVGQVEPVRDTTPAAADVTTLLAEPVTILSAIRSLESLDRQQIADARAKLETLLTRAPESVAARIALANALVLEFESQRGHARPDRELLRQAEQHAVAACQAAPHSPEAWSAVAVVYHRLNRPLEAVAAARKAVALEPGEGVVQHHLRLAFVAGGGERLRAANRVIDSLPGNALARWLAATVFIARGAIDAALEHIHAGCVAQDLQHVPGRAAGAFGAVGLHLQRANVLASRGDTVGAEAAFARELASDGRGNIFSVEACANAHYGLAALAWRAGDHERAGDHLRAALARIADHPGAAAALARLDASRATSLHKERLTMLNMWDQTDGHDPIAAAIAQAVAFAMEGRHAEAAKVVYDALNASDVPGPGAAWIVPIEPILNVQAHPHEWVATLALIQQRAS